MARGPSGRLVLEVDPDLKRQLHAQVALEGRTLKDWFLEAAGAYLAKGRKRRFGNPVDRVSEPAGAYRRSIRRGSRRRTDAEMTRPSVRGGEE